MSFLILKIIRVYQKHLSPLLGPSCRFHPTCSEYALQAIETYGVFRGGFLAIKRILKCNPWGGSGADPLPKDK
jgi:putative membrane protein insertion efficiency factor|tara:strand:- start:94 stop:312 length:219 start_codon:yes stop_codon:yes gene_type:complete